MALVQQILYQYKHYAIRALDYSSSSRPRATLLPVYNDSEVELYPAIRILGLVE